MTRPKQELAKRLRELRRRHFGARGKELFARQLGVPLDEYERYERGTIPPGDVLVRVCDITGEDLQWLLTGVAARGTVVISGTRGRHQDVLVRLANLLEQRPELATAVEAFVDLLVQGEHVRGQVDTKPPALPTPQIEGLIRIFEADQTPPALPATDEPQYPLLPAVAGQSALQPIGEAELVDPAMDYEAQSGRRVGLIEIADDTGDRIQCVHNAEIRQCFPHAFGVRVADDAMRPMFTKRDAVIVAANAGPKVGRPVVCRLGDEPTVRCRIWLGDAEDTVHLGRLSDGTIEEVPADNVLWSLEALFRLSSAA